ncbi:hypothetical protein [Agromyces sp. ZXT2-6]|uniref:hypothetical protein n=1 Tax=Agromyces sp. ZXT2-6 TaxID=3461153 RepID=UPI004054DF7F
MFPLLDDERLNGPHVARINARPFRTAYPVPDLTVFSEIVELECQVWGGAASILLPTDASGMVRDLYRKRLSGAQVDRVYGAHGDREMRLDSPVPLRQERKFVYDQLAIGLLPWRKPELRPPLEIMVLEPNDPWSGIYAACLGSLPEHVDKRLIEQGNWLPDVTFEDFLTIRRTPASGSLDDLLSRTWPDEPVMSPRQVSMTSLAYGGTASSGIRSPRVVLPDDQFAKHDAGPNVLVVCSPNSIDDLALLWNLRGAHGDHYALPIGIPREQLTLGALNRILYHHGAARHGSAVNLLYITSASMTPDQLRALLGGDGGHAAIRSADEMIMFGQVSGWSRDETLVWAEGHARYKLLDRSGHRDILDERNVSDMLGMHFDVMVEDAPLPVADDFRADPINGAFYGGVRTTWNTLRSAEKFSSLEWPSRLLIARAVAAVRGLELQESAPGVASRVMLEKLGGIGQIGMLCHAPLLELLESMAVREGFPWFKAKLRERGVEADPSQAIATSTDELPTRSFNEFQRALGNTKAARYWLRWAEESSVILKGFEIHCPTCGAKQWIPVNSFAPPISCRGCGATIDPPFGDRTNIEFKYRIAEPLRRVYEADAMGHILAVRFFADVFSRIGGSELIGLHPGMNVQKQGEKNVLGEADVLLLTRSGEFIPVEVKRTSSGLTDGELSKLETLSTALSAPWSALAITQYGVAADPAFVKLTAFNDDGSYRRLTISYDSLLQSHSFWGLGADPFENAALTPDEIASRQADFVKGLVARADDTVGDWLAYSLLQPRASLKQDD